MRTTIDIDDPILKDLKRLQRQQGKSLGRLVSDLLAQALQDAREPRKTTPFKWVTRPMHAQIDLADREAVRDAMDEAGK